MYIDAICINQGDLDERSQQVRLMRDIYANATEVIVWLGCDEPGVEWECSLESGIEFYYARFQDSVDLNEFARRWKAKVSGFFECRAAQLATAEAEPEAIRANGFGANQEAWSLVVPFLSQDYWKRIWIVQEIMLAGVLLLRWKNFSLSGDTFFQLLRLSLGIGRIESIDQLHTTGDALQKRLEVESRKVKEPHDSQVLNGVTAYLVLSMRNRSFGVVYQPVCLLSLHEALVTFSWHHCSLPYDRIFGLLGLTSSVLRADYRMPKLELAARVLFETLLRLDAQSPSGANWMTIVALYRATLSAAGLDIGHPSVS